MSTRHDSMDWVMKHLSALTVLALERFCTVNPHYRGANWDDCLDILMDSDSHIDVFEPMWEACYPGSDTPVLEGYDPSLVDAVMITCLWADKTFALTHTPIMRAVAVKATIDAEQRTEVRDPRTPLDRLHDAIKDVEHWFQDHDNMVLLAYWMKDHGHSVDDMVSLIEKPWKWTPEYFQAKDDAAKDAARELGTDGS